MISPNDPTEPVAFPSTNSHLFLIDDGERWWYAAKDETHAIAQFVDDTFGGTVEEYRAECPDTTVTQLADDFILTICMERGCTDDEEEERDVTQTAREWCADIGGEGCVGTSMCD